MDYIYIHICVCIHPSIVFCPFCFYEVLSPLISHFLSTKAILPELVAGRHLCQIFLSWLKTWRQSLPENDPNIGISMCVKCENSRDRVGI